MKFLDWFIEEQQEEEDNAEKQVSRMRLFGSDAKALYDLDRENAARVYARSQPAGQRVASRRRRSCLACGRSVRLRQMRMHARHGVPLWHTRKHAGMAFRSGDSECLLARRSNPAIPNACRQGVPLW